MKHSWTRSKFLKCVLSSEKWAMKALYSIVYKKVRFEQLIAASIADEINTNNFKSK